MNSDLARLQARFSQALNHNNDAVLADITSDEFSAGQRLQIYRNNFVISLSEVLEASYPLLRAVIGEACFYALARHHVMHHPPTCADVSSYGAGLDSSIAALPQIHQAVPYAADLARFEWQLDQVQQSYATSPRPAWRPLDDLNQLSAAQHVRVQLRLWPWVRLCSAPYALFDLREAIHSDDFSALQLTQTQTGLIACDSDGHPWTRVCNEPEYHLLHAISNATPLGAIAPPLLATLPALTRLDIVAGFTLPGDE